MRRPRVSRPVPGALQRGALTLYALPVCALWAWLAAVAAAHAQSYAVQPYTYVRFSLGVPWALYFVFLLLVAVPFGVMIALAWRQPPRDAAGKAPAEAPAPAAHAAQGKRRSA